MGGHDVTVKLVWMMQTDTAVTEETLSSIQTGNREISFYFSQNLTYNMGILYSRIPHTHTLCNIAFD